MMTKAIIVTHGNLGRELIATAKLVFGDFDGVVAVSNSNKAPAVLTGELEAVIGEDQEQRFILFVDYFGGSTCHACLSVANNNPRVTVISGVNLPMLLAFLYKRGDVSFDELPDELTARGQRSIRMVDPEKV